MKHFIIGIIISFALPLWCVSQTIEKEYSQKFSATTVSKLQSYQAKVKTRGITAKDNLFAYIRLRPETDIQDLCNRFRLHLNIGYDGIYTAIIPMDMLESLAQENTVLDIDTGQEVRTMMDSVRILTHIDEIQSGLELPNTYQGEGTIIGIIDNGFDFTHPNFRDEAGNCRIQRVWDQNQIFGSSNSSYGYGLVYATTEKILAAKHDMSGDTHGTHVAGIATGSCKNQYKGVAPKADIVLVSTNRTEQGILDGIDFLLHYADEMNKPLSINLSMGTILGYKDGTDKFSLLIDNLMKDKKGKLLSIAAGNEGNRNSTLTGTFDKEHSVVKSYLIPPSYNRENLFIQGIAGNTYTLTICLKDTANNKIRFSENFISGEKWSKSYKNFGSGESNDAILNISSTNNPVNNNPAFNINLSYTKPEQEAWEISLSGENGKYMVNCDYGNLTSAGKAGYTNGTTDYTIACTATGYEALSVGAYVSKESYIDLSGTPHHSDWKRFSLYSLSGKGPTYDGRIKPDVVAPGATVISSFNSFAGSYSIKPTDKVFEMVEPSGKKYTWGIANGTSMATPVVTGTLALWLEANPELTLKEAKNILSKTAYHDSFTGNSVNGLYGMGKLDAIAGLQEILLQTSVVEEKLSQIDFIYDRKSHTIKFISATPIKHVYFYSISGKLLYDVCNPGNNECHIKQSPGGVYILNVVTSEASKTFKIII